MNAGSTTVEETLGLLEGEFESFVSGLADGRYVLWLGSGVSRDRLPDLREIALKVLCFLRDGARAGDSRDAYRAALEKAVALALRPNEVEAINMSDPLESWPHLDDLLDGLIGKYAELLGLVVEGRDSDLLLWEAVDVRGTYGPGHDPDCEHLCIAILALEGAVPDAASTNWDGLIEAAFDELGREPSELVRVVVLPEDLREDGRTLNLLKFHGCAVRATDDPLRYRGALVATRRQITEWSSSDDTRVIRNELTQMATTRPTLVVGLSAQDENIQQLFAAAANSMSWTWPVDPPGHVFAGGAVGDHHLNLLRVVYGEETADQVARSALVPAYAKAFLTALVLAVLTRKLRAYLIEASTPELAAADREHLADGLSVVAHRLAAAGDESDRLAFIQKFAEVQGRALRLFRDPSRLVASGPAAFQPLSGLSPARVPTDPGLTTSGLPELAAALALLGRGLEAKVWTLDTGEEAPLKVNSAAGEAEVFFAANARVATDLVASGMVDPEAAKAVIIHSTEPVAPAQRSPRGRYGRTGEFKMREVGMRDLLMKATSLPALEQDFRQAVAL